MIKFITDKNILNTDAEILVNTVNTVGVMGAGLAKAVREKFPECFGPYERACRDKSFNIGDILEVSITRDSASSPPNWIFHFPTKTHWKYPSKLSYIETGLNKLVFILSNKSDYTYIKKVAIPALGSSLGHLNWLEVKRLIENRLTKPDVPEHLSFDIYEPFSELAAY